MSDCEDCQKYSERVQQLKRIEKKMEAELASTMIENRWLRSALARAHESIIGYKDYRGVEGEMARKVLEALIETTRQADKPDLGPLVASAKNPCPSVRGQALACIFPHSYCGQQSADCVLVPGGSAKSAVASKIRDLFSGEQSRQADTREPKDVKAGALKSDMALQAPEPVSKQAQQVDNVDGGVVGETPGRPGMARETETGPERATSGGDDGTP